VKIFCPDVAAVFDMSYYTVRSHLERLAARGAIRLVDRTVCNNAVYEITCPESAEAERGVDREPPARVIRWG
jgi:predicted ArsR family transcriptional regulator